MKLRFALVGIIAAMLAASLPVAAHHSFAAEYDGSKQLTLKGKVVETEWINPHSWVHFEVIGTDGKATIWKAETPPPNVLYRNGWRPDTIKKGENIQVTGNAAKDGSTHMWAGNVQLLDSGGTLSFGSRPPGEGPPDAKGKGK